MKITTESEVLSLDPNTILLPFSSVDITAHLVQEGIVLVRYTRMSEDGLLPAPIVESVNFFENQRISKSNDLILSNVPYTLELDRI